MTSDQERQPERRTQLERLRQIEELRAEMHRRMGGRYDPSKVAALVEISRELDRLVVEVTRRQWSGHGKRYPEKHHRSREER